MSTPEFSATEGHTASGRLETLTDGVFAIVLTLLVLEIHVPDVRLGLTEAQLQTAILNLAPTFASYVVSFIIIGVYWVGHHSQFQYIRRADQTLLWLNLLFLMSVGLIPFSAALLGRFGEYRFAAMIYGINLIATALFHFSMWRYATRGRRLVDKNTPDAVVTLGTQLSLLPPVVYLIAIGVAFFDPMVSLLLYALVPIPYALGWIYRWIARLPGPA